jgi:hypothetical protein
MSLASDPLPTDPEALRQFAAGLQTELARKEIEIAANAAEIHAKTLHIEQLKTQLAVLRRARFGRSSEKLGREIEQLELLIGNLEEEAAEAQARATTKQHAQTDTDPLAQPRQRCHPTRTPLPAHLPRETITHEPVCTCPGCGGSLFSRIGQDEREVLEYVPSSFKVIRHVRPKLSCRACDRSSTVPSRKKLKGRDNPRVDGGVALHVLDWQSAAGDRLHTGRQRDASGTQSQAGRGPGRGSQHESPAILLHLGLGQCIEIANDGGP